MEKKDMLLFENMCDRCYKLREEGDTFWGFAFDDDRGEVRRFQGHRECIDEIVALILETTKPFREEENKND